MATRDDEVEELAHALHLAQASELALSRGDAVRAFELALEDRDLSRAEAALGAMATEADPATRALSLRRARAIAVRRGASDAEARVAELAGDVDEACALYERAGEWRRAANLHRARGDLGHAGRALERAVAADPGDDSARRELATLLVDAGRHEAALRALGGLADDRAVTELRARAHAGLGLEGVGAQPPAAPLPTDDTLLFGRYQVVREVASTASSRVLEAIDRLSASRERVALKIFTGAGQVGTGRDALARFRREMDILTHVEAPSILRARDVIAEGPTIVLPWMAGGSLAELLATGPLPPRRAGEIAGRLLQALEAAHRRGVVHRDVKPANVLLDEVGGAYLADFGVAHLGDASVTATAGLLGTVRWMSPEQKLGVAATAKSDVYAVGLVLAEMLGVSVETLGPEVPVEVVALLRAWLADDPAARPDATAARSALAALPWPARSFGAAPTPSARAPAPSLRPAGERFVPLGDGRQRDILLERDEWLVAPLDPRVALVRAMSAVVDATLPTVLGVHASTGALRVEALDGARVDSLDARDSDALAATLHRLHEAGAAHGDVAGSLRRTLRGLVLTLPAAALAGEVGADLAALASLRRA